MLQALERQQIDSSSSTCEERTNVQSPAPTNYQQRDIYVRMCFHVEKFNHDKSLRVICLLNFIFSFRIFMMVTFKIDPILINIFYTNQHSVKSMLLLLQLLKNYLFMVHFLFTSLPMVMIHI